MTVMKIGLAALMHDIGKFAQTGMVLSEEYRKNNAGQYQPYNKQKNYYSHQHVLYTAAFIEQFAEILPAQLNSANWADGDSFINLAAGHHNPETPLQTIITVADRASSGMDRAEFEEGDDIAIANFLQTRLLPIFEQLDPHSNKTIENEADFGHQYPLQALSAESIFARPRQAQEKDVVRGEYQALFDSFTEELKGLANKDKLNLWLQHFDSLLARFTSLIPAARVGRVVPDVSLYDHAKTTASLASALYLYHSQTDSLNQSAILDDRSQKLLLISGDFYGIQDFIFSQQGESAKYQSKLLRGRSFMVSMFSELASKMVCEELGLNPLSIILNAAGKFHILAPNTPATQDALQKVREKINHWLFSISYGQSSIGITATPASLEDFTDGRFVDLWNRHQKNMQIAKSQKIDIVNYAGTVNGYLDSFNNDLGAQICPHCNIRPTTKEAEQDRTYLESTDSACSTCRDHIMLGTKLVKGEYLVVAKDSAALPREEGLLKPIYDHYQIFFSPSAKAIENAADDILKIYQTNPNTDGSLTTPVTSKLINGYVPIYGKEDLHDTRLCHARSQEDTAQLQQGVENGAPKTFNDLCKLALNPSQQSEKSQGTEALGILKADIDDLGLLMSCGLPDKRITISRMATLSRQLDNFFSLYLPHMLQEEVQFRNTYTVFAGGDDLFLIGPWSKMPELALFLRDRFIQYVCANEHIHFSAGISMHKAHTPVEKLAFHGEEALEGAKDSGKNRVTIFDQTVTWEQLTELNNIQSIMASWLERGCISSSMFYKFNHFITMVEQEKALLNNSSMISVQEMDCLKWRPHLLYSLVRNIDKKYKNEERQHILNEVKSIAVWLEQYGAAMKIPLWNILYNKR